MESLVVMEKLITKTNKEIQKFQKNVNRKNYREIKKNFVVYEPRKNFFSQRLYYFYSGHYAESEMTDSRFANDNAFYTSFFLVEQVSKLTLFRHEQKRMPESSKVVWDNAHASCDTFHFALFYKIVVKQQLVIDSHLAF